MGDGFCIDISAPINFQAAFASGVMACVIKCTEGTSVADSNQSFHASKAAALTAGLVAASYHVLHPGSADGQADFFLNALSPVRGERVAVDCEVSGLALNDIRLFVQTVLTARPDLKATVYGNYSFLSSVIGAAVDPFLAAHTDLWIAEWDELTPIMPSSTWPTWRLQQYTANQALYGGIVDLDRFNGTNAELIAWIGPASVSPPAPSMTTVQMQPALLALHFDLGPTGANGIWGPHTQAALDGFRKIAGLPTGATTLSAADIATLTRDSS